VLEQRGLRLLEAGEEGADYLVLGRLLRLHRLPKISGSPSIISRPALRAQLDEAQGRRLPIDYRPSQLEKLRLMLFHRERKNRKLALQLLEAGGVPEPLLTDLFLAWKLNYGPSKRLELLLLQYCSEEALRNLYAPLGLQGRINRRRLATHIQRYTEGNELDASRIRSFLEG